MLKLPISDITPFTLLDYPNHTACILWFAGCNFRCAYCHNPELIEGKKPKHGLEKILGFLKSRTGLLDAVVMSGGECTLAPDFLEFVKIVKSLGFKVKIDTNGSKPEQIEKLLASNSIDYVALDYKAPLNKLAALTGWHLTGDFECSLQLLCHSNIELEIRTTVHSDQLDEGDINSIMQDLKQRGFKGNYFVQNYRDAQTLGKLPVQSQILQTHILHTPNQFQLGLRNF